MRKALSAVTRSARLTFVVVWAALSLASVAWAISTPLVASPDEPAHIVKAASVVRGEFIGSATDDPATRRVQVPVGLSQIPRPQYSCTAFKPEVTADCIAPLDNGLQLHSADTSAGLYNPVYYAAVGWPSLFIADTKVDIYAMRALTGILSSLFLAFTFTLLLRMTSPVVAGLAFFAGLTPMVLFLNGSVNPNSLEIATAAALTVGLLYVALGAQGLRRSTVLAFVVASGVLLANARGLSLLWMALIGVGVLVFAPWSMIRNLIRKRSVIISLGIMALGAVFAAVWVLATGTLNAAGHYGGIGTTPIRAFLVMLIDRTADIGVIGDFGWLDTPAPNAVMAVWSMLILGVAVVCLAVARGRALWSFILAVAVAVLVPPIAQTLSISNSGYIWQGRYTLCAIVCALLVGAIGFGRSEHAHGIPARVGTKIIAISSFLVLAGQLDAMVGSMRRYSTPKSTFSLDFLRSSVGQPPGGSIAWLLVLAVAFVVLFAVWFASRALPRPVYAEVSKGA